MDIAANSTLKEQSDTENDVEPDGNSEDNSDGDGMEQSYRPQNPTVLGTGRKPTNKKTSI